MPNTVITTHDIQSAAILALDLNDTLTITAGAGIYWSGDSAIRPSLTAPTNTFNVITVHGTLEVRSVTAGQYSRFLVGAQGSVVTSLGLIISANSVLQNHGTIAGDSGGSASGAVKTSIGNSSIANFGVIAGTIGVALNGPQDILNNMGQIFGTAVGVQMRSNNEQVTNSGTLTSRATGIEAYGEFDSSGTVPAKMTITNSGLIEGLSFGIRSFAVQPGSTLTIVNTGTILSQGVAIQGGTGADSLTNSGTIIGNLEFGSGADFYYGLGGLLTGIIYGGAGADNYYVDQSRIDIREAGADIDTVFADCHFRLEAQLENLNLLGAADHRGFGNAANNLLTGNAGDNRLAGLDGNDNLTGEFGDDTLIGGNGIDTLDGAEGNDTLQGGTGTDTLRGGEGDDHLDGGAARDSLTGNAGADIFVFTSLAHSGALTTTADILTDFTRGDDLIDLSAIDAKTNNAAPNDTFIFIGSAAFSNVAGQLRVTQTGGNTYVALDVNADSTADAMIRLTGLLTLTANDFIL